MFEICFVYLKDGNILLDNCFLICTVIRPVNTMRSLPGSSLFACLASIERSKVRFRYRPVAQELIDTISCSWTLWQGRCWVTAFGPRYHAAAEQEYNDVRHLQAPFLVLPNNLG